MLPARRPRDDLGINGSTMGRAGMQGEGPMSSTPLELLFADYAGAVPGVSATLLQNDVVLLATAFGLADIERKTAATPATNYRLASVSKQFTAMAILLLVAD